MRELEVLVAQGELLLAALGDRELPAASGLPGLTVGQLARHLVQLVQLVAQAAGTPSRGRPVALQAYVASVADFAEAAPSIAARTDEVAGDPRPELRRALDAVLAVAGPDRTVQTPRGPLRLSDLALTCVVELTVHGLDLGVTPVPDAVAVSVRGLARLLADRHPGRAVELRVAPYIAVQLLEGTVHRRGTPPAVVQTDPVTWLLLATGRLGWAEAVAELSVSASGERSDLSALLPVLR
jgi:uncharacterized protein (TIGR03083 family)